MSVTLSEIERKILDYMVEYLRSNTYQPSIREIGEQFGIKSTKTVSEHLQALADKGFLERDPSRSRGVRILGVDLNAHAISVPCFSSLPQDRNGRRASKAETFFTLDRRLAGEKGAFFVQASADELAPLGCMEGDYILLEPVSVGELMDGALVAARVGEQAAYYRFSRNGNTVALDPVGGGETPRVVHDSQKLAVLGRIKGMYRRMDQMAVSVAAVAH